MWRRTVGDTTVERFVAVIVVGGLGMLAGLWVLAIAASGPMAAAGAVLAVLGGLGVVAGIAAGIDLGAIT